MKETFAVYFRLTLNHNICQRTILKFTNLNERLNNWVHIKNKVKLRLKSSYNYLLISRIFANQKCKKGC